MNVPSKPLDATTEPPPRLGELIPTRNAETSKIEEQVRSAIAHAGYSIPEPRQAVWCRHPDAADRLLPLTPDVVLADHHILVEVDPCGDVSNSSHGSSHRGEEEQDLRRNALFAEAGWTVIRIRFDTKRGEHLGPRDVLVESSGFTKAAQNALLEAIDDAINERRARVRIVRKGKTPAPAQRRSQVVNIGEYHYS